MQNNRAGAFLRRHDMYYEQMPFAELTDRYGEEMAAGLAGRSSTLYMLPTYLRLGDEPAPEEPVLVLDAGGTNLRCARVRFNREGQAAVEELRKRRIPGTDGEVSRETFFREIAAFALEASRGCRRACISFSYPCEILPSGDGRILRLCKELRVADAEGALVCAGLEGALRALGAEGERRWRLVNDSVGSLLGGMAQTDRSKYAGYIGFILGTGTNVCCPLPAADITKAPAAAALGGSMIVNLESGCFGRLLLGTADRELDRESDLPGDHLAEKMISGAYYPLLLQKTWLLAVREGLLSPAVGGALAELTVKSPHVDQFCLDPRHGGPLAALPFAPAERAFAADVNDMLLERAARIVSACFCAILRRWALPPGSRVCICADGTTFRKNPVLRPKTEAYLRTYAQEALGVGTEFVFLDDATLLGSAWAGLTGES